MDRRTLVTGSLAIGASALLAGCSGPPDGRTGAGAPATSPAGSKLLVAYFSRPGENYYYGGRRHLEVGNTDVVANAIASAVPADVYRIQAAEPYPQDYDETVERNKYEQETEARPAIAGVVPDLALYDTVLLGSPIWNVRPPMIMRTFVESVDLRGKTIHPFVTYAVSGIGATVEDYTRWCPEATIGDGLAVRGEEVAGAGNAITAWLERTSLKV